MFFFEVWRETIFLWLKTALSLSSCLGAAICPASATHPCLFPHPHLSPFSLPTPGFQRSFLLISLPVCSSDADLSTFSLPLPKFLLQLVPPPPPGVCKSLVQLHAALPVAPSGASYSSVGSCVPRRS